MSAPFFGLLDQAETATGSNTVTLAEVAQPLASDTDEV
jgi:hypothetical protein